MAKDGRVFVPWRDQDLREVFAELRLAVVDGFTNTSALGMGEIRLAYVEGIMTRQAIHQKARPDPKYSKFYDNIAFLGQINDLERYIGMHQK